jgi:hypothetical protein
MTATVVIGGFIVSFKGSLQTVALPEVLTFLGETAKSGDLRVQGPHVEGSIRFDAGSIAGLDVGRSQDPVEAVFQLLRNESGDFDFDDAHDGGHGLRVEPAAAVVPCLQQAQERLAEWGEIVAVVPSLSHRVSLAAAAPADIVSLDADQWSLVVAVGEGRTVGQVLEMRELGEFDGCKALKALVEARLVEVAEPEPGPSIDYAPAEDLGDRFAVLADVLSDEPADVPADDEPGGDHYAALRAMIVDVDRDLSENGSALAGTVEAGLDGEDIGFVGETVIGHGEDSVFGEYPGNGEDVGDGEDPKSALQAVLAEVTSQMSGEEGSEAPPLDGLADRGPWPEHELAAMEAWQADAPTAEPGAEEVAEEEAAEGPAEEPINRGLLLKFLSSVRN